MNGLWGEQEKTATSTSFSTAWMFEEERNKQLCCDRKAKTKSKKKKKKKKREKKARKKKTWCFPFLVVVASVFYFSVLLGVFVCWFSDLRAALCVSLLSGHMAHGPEMGVLGHSSTLTGFDRWRRMSAFLG